MEESLHLVECEKRGCLGCGSREVADIVYDGTLVGAIAVETGTLHLFHPCSLAFGGAGEIIAHPDGYMFAGLCVDHIVDHHVLMIFWSVGHRDHLYPEEFLRGVEESFLHGLEFEVRTEGCLVEIEFLLLYLVSVIVVVVRGDFEAASMGVYVFLHVCNFLCGAGYSRFEHLHQQLGSCLRGLGHHAGGHHPGKVVKAHKSGLFIAQPDYLGDDREVGIVAVRCEAGVSLVDCLAEAAVVGILQYGQTARCMEREDPETVKVAGLGLLGCHRH